MTGSCTCKYVTYELLKKPMFVNCCHCTWCQRETGSAFVINALIESTNVKTLTGECEKILTPTESGRGQQIWRCPKCKVALWSNYRGAKDFLRFVRVGTMDKKIPPDAHIFTRSKLPWVIIPKDTLAAGIFYDFATAWPKESLERYEAVMKLMTHG